MIVPTDWCHKPSHASVSRVSAVNGYLRSTTGARTARRFTHSTTERRYRLGPSVKLAQHGDSGEHSDGAEAWW